MDPILERYQALEDKVAAYTPNLDTKRLFDAFTYADTEHHGQLRKSGEPYIIHPLAVADIVADLGLDVDSVIAALLHDCIEDTDATHEEIAKKFGKSVAELVEGVTKLTRVQYVSKEEEQMENLRKMLMAMAHDIRVILIKICDRLHNMRTMEYQSPRKQREKSLETMEIYAPLAHRLGMQKLKWELEDLSLRYLDPVGYKEIEEEMSARSAAHEEFLASIQLRIQQRMEQEGIRCKVYGRVKHTYSIYRKMFAQNKTLDEIIRFGIVGVAATLLQYGCYLLFLLWLMPTLANTLAYLVSFAFNYIASTRFTFRVKATTKRGMGFALSHLVNYTMQTLLLQVFLFVGMPKQWALIPVFCVCVPVNFLLVRFFLRK